MPNYDFQHLSPEEFEHLSRDLLQEQLQITFESFANGKDSGIDFRCTRNGLLIVQCKRYADVDSLFSNLKKELPKVIRLNPRSYIITTSVRLTPHQKEKIQQLFTGFIQSTSDIYGRDDLNNLLGLYPHIEERHSKLWFPQFNILKKVLSGILQKPLWVMAGLLVLVLAAMGLLYKGSEVAASLPAKPMVKPLFAAADKRFKVLILPWEQECDYEQKKYDIGRVIKKELDQLGLEDSLGLYTLYYTDSLDFRNLTHEMVDSLMVYHHADFVLYGAYSFKECEGGTSDKIVFNYQSNFKSMKLAEVHPQIDHTMQDIDGLADLRRGNGYEKINYILYWVAAIAEIKNREFARAIGQLQAIKGFQEKENVLFQLGCCHYFLNHYDSARIYNEQLLKMNPKHKDAAVHLAIILCYEGQFQEARERLEKVLAAAPDDIDALINVARVCYKVKDSAAGKSYLIRLLQLIKKDNEGDIAFAGSLYNEMGDYGQSVACYEKSLQMHAQHADRWTELAAAYGHLKDRLRVRQCLQNAIRVDSNYWKAWYQLGDLHMQRRVNDTALICFEKVVQLNPSFGQAWAALGLNHYFLDHRDQAMTCLKKAFAINPRDIATLYWSFFVYKNLNDYPQAKYFLNTLVALYPADVNLQKELSLVNDHLAKVKQGVKL